MTVAVIEHEVLEPGEKTLEELAETANRNYREMGSAVTHAVECAIAVGDALNEARNRFTSKSLWENWLRENFHAGYDQAAGVGDKRRAIANTMTHLFAAEVEIAKAPEIPS